MSCRRCAADKRARGADTSAPEGGGVRSGSSTSSSLTSNGIGLNTKRDLRDEEEDAEDGGGDEATSMLVANRPSMPSGLSSSTSQGLYSFGTSFGSAEEEEDDDEDDEGLPHRYTSRHSVFSRSQTVISPRPVPPATQTHLPRPLVGWSARR